MSDLRAAAQLALEAMEYHIEQTRPLLKTSQAIAALRAALDGEPSVDAMANHAETSGSPEPVAFMYVGIRHDGRPHDSASLIWRPEYMDVMSASMGAKAVPLYTAPSRREPLRTVTYVCPVCAASLERQE